MVGGVVIGLTFRSDGTAHVNVADCPHHPKHGRGDECPRPDTCCVTTDGACEDGSKADIQIGDSFWWQGGWCYWTPAKNRTLSNARGGVDYDIRLGKIGYSH